MTYRNEQLMHMLTSQISSFVPGLFSPEMSCPAAGSAGVVQTQIRDLWRTSHLTKQWSEPERDEEPEAGHESSDPSAASLSDACGGLDVAGDR